MFGCFGRLVPAAPKPSPGLGFDSDGRLLPVVVVSPEEGSEGFDRFLGRPGLLFSYTTVAFWFAVTVTVVPVPVGGAVSVAVVVVVDVVVAVSAMFPDSLRAGVDFSELLLLRLRSGLVSALLVERAFARF